MIEYEEALGNGEVGHRARELRAHGLGIELVAVAQRDERHHALAEDGVRGADDGRLGDLGQRG